ncbi:MAG: response regulator [Bacteroidales bacterium]|nr:response regulator [Bacteroidales bacterium]MBN2764325.1 response regulator [Bacteroidales bacterium]
MIKSLRYRLLAWLLSFVILTFVFIIPANFIYQKKTRKISSVVQQINGLYASFLKDSKTISDFLLIESLNPDFYKTGQSRQLLKHYKINEIISLTIKALRADEQNKAFWIIPDLDPLILKLNDFNVLFDSLVYLTYKRGYNDFGLAGEMNDYGNRLEKIAGMHRSQLFQLRKNEKDYLQWHNQEFLDHFRKTAADFNTAIEKDRSLSPDNRLLLTGILDNYRNAFERLVDLDNKIGLAGNANLSASLNQKGKEIESLFMGLTQKSALIQQSLIDRLNFFYFGYLFMIIALSVFAGFLISKHIVSHLEQLTAYISSLTRNKFNHQPIAIDLKNSASEITEIYKEFQNMLSQIHSWEKQHGIVLKNAEENKKRYQELADMLPQSIFETDNWGNYTYVNKAWFSTFKYSGSDLKTGINLTETLISENNDDILQNDKFEDATFVAVRKDQSRFEASVYMNNIIKEGRISGKRGIIIDISDKIRYINTLKDETSKAQTSDQLKSSFLANMSHEIRTPMNSIIGFSNLLASEEVPEDQKKSFVQYIQSSGEVLLNLVDDIIDIAKIEAGELKIVKKECNLTGLLNELHHTFNEVKNRVNKEQLEIILSCEPENQNLLLKTDPFRLRQILSNLLGNAIKFTEKGSVTFGYKVTSEEKLEFFVKDTGVGLTREELDLIFDRFKRTLHSEEKNIIGTGLGLTISKNLVELLGGEMWVNSSPGKGTTFFFTLPYLKITKTLPGFQDTTYEYNFNWKGKIFLIVEDDPNSMNYLTQVLKKTDVTILQAHSGEKAVEICRDNSRLDLVIMDIQMPGMDGIEATSRIKQLNPQLPVIAQTAFAMAGDKERITKAGCDDYLAKPVDSKQLLPKINALLKEKDHTIPSASYTDADKA